MTLIAMALINLVSIFGWGTTTPTVQPGIYIQSSLTGSYTTALKAAIKFDGKYTHSRLTIHRCDNTHRCIIIKGAKLNKNTRGLTWPSNTRATIEINTHYSQSNRIKEIVIAHELGHGLGIIKHNPRCTSVMYHSLYCNGHLIPLSFTASERKILKKA